MTKKMKHIKLYKNFHLYESFHRPANREGWAILVAFSAGMGTAAAKIFPAAEADRAYYDLLAQRVTLGYKLKHIGPGEEEQQMTREWDPHDTYLMVGFDETSYTIAGGTIEDAQEQANEIYIPGQSPIIGTNAADSGYAYAFPVSPEHWTVLDPGGNILFEPTPEKAFSFTKDPGLLAAADKEVNPRWE
jgi:hypothetical protein